LARRGLGLSAALFGTALVASGASAALPASLLENTLQSALHFAAEQTAPGLASARVISLWEAATGKEVRQFPGIKGGLAYLALSPEGKLVAATCRDNLLRVWAVGTGKLLPTTRCIAERLAFSPDSKTLAFVDLSAQPVLWDPVAGKVIRHFKIPEEPRNGFYSYAIAFSPDGKTLYKSNILSGLDSWEVSTAKHLGRLKGRPDRPDASWTGSFAHSPLVMSADGRTLAFPGRDGSVGLVELTTAQPRRTFAGRQGGVTCLAFSPDGKTLASGSQDSTILIWDLTAPALGEKRPRGPLTAKELEALWTDLGSDNAGKAYRAVLTLTAFPRQAVSFLKKQAPPVQPADAKQIDRLIADLGSKKFATRTKAYHALEALGETALPALTTALGKNPSVEVSKRLEKLIARVQESDLPPNQLRVLRAVEVLESIGSAEAREVFTEMARGAAGARLTEEARLALERLKRRER
jgi:hypothetical protein